MSMWLPQAFDHWWCVGCRQIAPKRQPLRSDQLVTGRYDHTGSDACAVRAAACGFAEHFNARGWLIKRVVCADRPILRP
jgi:hypothetical protein